MGKSYVGEGHAGSYQPFTMRQKANHLEIPYRFILFSILPFHPVCLGCPVTCAMPWTSKWGSTWLATCVVTDLSGRKVWSAPKGSGTEC